MILPVSRGGRTISSAISLHRRQTQAQETTLFLSGQRSSLTSTLLMISVRSSGSSIDHRSSASSSLSGSIAAAARLPNLASPPPQVLGSNSRREEEGDEGFPGSSAPARERDIFARSALSRKRGRARERKCPFALFLMQSIGGEFFCCQSVFILLLFILLNTFIGFLFFSFFASYLSESCSSSFFCSGSFRNYQHLGSVQFLEQYIVKNPFLHGKYY